MVDCKPENYAPSQPPESNKLNIFCDECESNKKYQLEKEEDRSDK